jgi:hypothetical protein
MRPFATRAARGVLSLVFCLAACAAGESTPPPTPTPHVTAVPTQRVSQRALGLGEPRIPQPFTIEQRLLDGVSRSDRQTIERALERGAPLTTKDDIGRSVVLLAVLDARDLDLVKWLHAKGAALDEPDNGGRTALSFAAEKGLLDIARYLLDHGAAVDRADVQRKTPLLHAALGDHREVATLLLDRKADVNARDQFGDTPLIVACAKGYGDMAALLLRRGADPALKDQEGRAARERAAGGTDVCLGATSAAP